MTIHPFPVWCVALTLSACSSAVTVQERAQARDRVSRDRPTHFFNNPHHERTKRFLSQILH